MTFPLRWVSHLKSAKEQKEFETYVRNSRLMLDRLAGILAEELAGIEGLEISPATYDSPGWAFQQAHINGQRSIIKKLLTLVNYE